MERKLSKLSLACLICVANGFGLPDVFAKETGASLPSAAAPLPRRAASLPIKIRDIIVENNKAVSKEAILAKLPYRPGGRFDQRTTDEAIQSVYSLGYFSQIQIIVDDIEEGLIDLIVNVTEKKRLSNIYLKGNSSYETPKLLKELETERIKTLDETDIPAIVEKIKRTYRDKKSYHHVTVTSELKPAANDQAVDLYLTIKEGIPSYIRKVCFNGARCISPRTIRARIFTRESWPLGFMDHAGTYHPDAVQQDKYVIENLFQSNGFLMARVTDAKVEEHDSGAVDVTFTIDEGDLYTVSKVSAEGNDILTEGQLLSQILICPGQLYSKDAVRSTMEQLRTIWGEYGYIYADVQPSIRPNPENKTVEIAFYTDLGKCIKVNRVDILGNTKTLRKVIQREFLFDEGDTLTTRMLEESKRRVQLLGFFEQRNGVEWRMIKTDEEHVDLELLLIEAKTGRISGEAGFGGQADMFSPTNSWSLRLNINDSNFLGTGTRYAFIGSYSRQDKSIDCMIGNNWLFDKPISGSLQGFAREMIYEDFRQTELEPVERNVGGAGHLGFRIDKFNFALADVALGYEKITYKTDNVARAMRDREIQQIVQMQIDHSLQPGRLLWLGASLQQDFRDHPYYPTSGYLWVVNAKLGIPHGRDSYGFIRCTFDYHWYTTLIEQYGLVFHLRGSLGGIGSIQDHVIPYRELFHIGGPATVRGFLYGQIGPMLLDSSLGGTRELVLNAELLFPISADGGVRGALFYDGGASWHTPDADTIQANLLHNNSFGYRHAVGFGVSLERPTPMKIEIGFKLDRKRNEKLYEVHLGMNQQF